MIGSARFTGAPTQTMTDPARPLFLPTRPESGAASNIMRAPADGWLR
jgi:hypothetical protein